MIEPSVLTEIKNLYIYSNPENFQSPNLSAICRKFDIEYKAVQKICAEEDWLGQRIEFQDTFREKKEEGIVQALEDQALDVGSQITAIIQKSITTTSEYEQLIDEKLFKILREDEIELTVKELIDLKKLVIQRQDSIVKVLMEISKSLQEKNGASKEDADNSVFDKFLKKLTKDSSLTIVAHEIQAQVEGKETSYDKMPESDRTSLFEKLDNKGNEDVEVYS